MINDLQRKCYVQLGRSGDIINILPLLYQHAKYSGTTPNLLVASDYASLLDGCSYVNPVIHHGDFADLSTALSANRSRFKDFIITQVYAHGMCVKPATSSFLIESWHRIGRASDWDQLQLVFDKRVMAREEELRRRFISISKPTILVASRGLSSPFPHTRQLMDLLNTELSPTHHIIDLANIKATRFFDLLGLFDHAHALITIDTGHMHLARASKVPVVALVTDGPTPWHTSAPMKGQILRMKYSEFPQRAMEVVGAIRNIRGDRTFQAKRPVIVRKDGSKRGSRSTFHIYSDYQRQGDSLRRHQFAAKTWETLPWIRCPVLNTQLTRTSASVFSDTRHMPFIKDLVNVGIMDNQVGPNDLIVLTNDDIGVVVEMNTHLSSVTDASAAWSNRWDFREVRVPLSTEQCRTGNWCCGTDFFAFTRNWWEKHQHIYPDFVLGCEAWDWVMRELIRDTGGFEIHALTYHLSHPSYWQSGTNRFRNPGNMWNQRLAKAWLADRNKPLRELAPLKV